MAGMQGDFWWTGRPLLTRSRSGKFSLGMAPPPASKSTGMHWIRLAQQQITKKVNQAKRAWSSAQSAASMAAGAGMGPSWR